MAIETKTCYVLTNHPTSETSATNIQPHQATKNQNAPPQFVFFSLTYIKNPAPNDDEEASCTSFATSRSRYGGPAAPSFSWCAAAWTPLRRPSTNDEDFEEALPAVHLPFLQHWTVGLHPLPRRRRRRWFQQDRLELPARKERKEGLTVNRLSLQPPHLHLQQLPRTLRHCRPILEVAMWTVPPVTTRSCPVTIVRDRRRPSRSKTNEKISWPPYCRGRTVLLPPIR